MPTYDGGHYFLTVLVPIHTKPVKDDQAVTSPVHALRKRLSMLPTAAETPAYGGGQSPFARNTRTHFARFVIIDDIAYVGRSGRNALVGSVGGDNLTVAQPQDHLNCPFLLFTADFDANSGNAEERDSYLAELWNTMGPELRDIFGFCRGFDSKKVTDGTSFAAYMAACQLETTMSFNDYYIDPLNLPTWPSTWYVGAIIAAAGVIALGLIGTLVFFVAQLFTQSWQSELHYAAALALLGAVALGGSILAAYASIMAAGAKPFPAAPDSNLPTVLKSLYLQRVFTRFAIDSQMQAVGKDALSARKLYNDFSKFVAANKPNDLQAPTQSPGVIGT
jgi:hypothetical protein